MSNSKDKFHLDRAKMKFDLQSIELSINDKKRKLNLPDSPSCELAEFLGIMTGDGYMNKYGKYFSLLEIAGDSNLDNHYLTTHVTPMIKSLFNLEPSVFFKKNENSMYLRLMSKGLNAYLESIGFKNGKKGQISVPSWVCEDEEYMLSFLKGLADTDGSLVLLNRKQKKFKFFPRIQITSISKPLVVELKKWFDSTELVSYITEERRRLEYKGETKTHLVLKIELPGRKNLNNWMKLIGFRNKRHLDRYKRYKDGAAGI